MAVWVADLARFYAEATRVLRDGALLLGDEPEGWEGAPLRRLPLHLIIAARKDRTPPAL